MTFDASFSFGAMIASVIGILVSIVGFLIIRTLNKLDETLDMFHTRLRTVENDVAEMRGFDRGYETGKRAITHTPQRMSPA